MPQKKAKKAITSRLVAAEVICMVYENPGVETPRTIADKLMETRDESLRERVLRVVSSTIHSLVVDGFIRYQSNVLGPYAHRTNVPLVPRSIAEGEWVITEDDGDAQ